MTSAAGVYFFHGFLFPVLAATISTSSQRAADSGGMTADLSGVDRPNRRCCRSGFWIFASFKRLALPNTPPVYALI